jgi:hypothetical protein
MWTIFLIMVLVLGLSWGAYYYYEYRLEKEERILKESGTKAKSEKLLEAQKTFEDYAKKMAEFKKPPGPPRRQ